jgi:hypothetical protein
MRVCPQCRNQLTAGQIVAYSDTLECPRCGASLRVSDASRIVGAFLALAVGLLMWRAAQGKGGYLNWLLPEVYAFLAFSFVYAFYLMFAANVVARPPDPVAAPLADAHGHAPAHH